MRFSAWLALPSITAAADPNHPFALRPLADFYALSILERGPLASRGQAGLEASNNVWVLGNAAYMFQSQYNRTLQMGAPNPRAAELAERYFLRAKALAPNLDRQAILPQLDPHGIARARKVELQAQRDWQERAEEAIGMIRRLPVEAFPELPPAVAGVLRTRNCRAPQPSAGGAPRNVIRGEFFAKGEAGWAVLCSVNNSTALLAFRNDRDTNPQTIITSDDQNQPSSPRACGMPTVQDGLSPSNPQYIKNNPTDAYGQFDQNFQAQWVQSAVSRYGPGGQGGVAIWNLDNEPIWWDNVHMDIHPNPYTYDENLALDTTYAAAIKSADPTALVSGPVADNWASLFFSKTDIVAGWSSPSGTYWSNPVDRNAHGGVPFLSWYLQQMQQYEQQHGTRLLDYLDVHAYYQPASLSGTETPALDALRLDSTREFWDPTYVVSGDYWIVDTTNNGAPVAPMLIPRLQQIGQQNYPGTKIAISEYNWTGARTLNGALTEAEILGIFGWQGLDMATFWGPPVPNDPVAFVFQMFRNYDGIGGAFGETSVGATSADRSSLSVYGALRDDLNLTALVINKLKSLLDAGFRCLGDLRWISNRELRQFHYIGIKNAQQLRDILRRFDQRG